MNITLIIDLLSGDNCNYSDGFNEVSLDETGVSTLFIFQNSITGLEIGDEIALFDSDGIIFE